MRRIISAAATTTASGKRPSFLSRQIRPSSSSASPRSASPSSSTSDQKQKQKRRRRLTVAVRNAVWNEWIGIELGRGPCFCCGRPITQQDYECGHVVAVAKGGSDAVSNLRPVCRACNRSMRTRDLYEFKAASGFANAIEMDWENSPP